MPPGASAGDIPGNGPQSDTIGCPSCGETVDLTTHQACPECGYNFD